MGTGITLGIDEDAATGMGIGFADGAFATALRLSVKLMELRVLSCVTGISSSLAFLFLRLPSGSGGIRREAALVEPRYQGGRILQVPV